MDLIEELIDFIFNFLNKECKDFNLNEIEKSFFQKNILKFNVKSFSNQIFDLYLNFHHKFLNSWSAHLNELGKRLVQKSEFCNLKIDKFVTVSLKEKNVFGLGLYLKKKCILNYVFSQINHIEKLSKKLNCIIVIESKKEWNNLRIKIIAKALENLLNVIQTNKTVVFFAPMNTETLFRKEFFFFQNAYLVYPQCLRDDIKVKTLKNSFKDLEIIEVSNIECSDSYQEYKEKAKKKLRNKFDDENIYNFIAAKILSHPINRNIILDLKFEKIIFNQYNYARVNQLLNLCKKKFSLKNVTITNFNSSLLKYELEMYTFNDHFIDFFLLKNEIKSLIENRKLYFVFYKILILINSLCHSLSKYYHKRKLLVCADSLETIVFKINLLNSVLSIIKLSYELLGLELLEEI